MCETEREERPWQLYIRDMIDFGEKVLAYTGGLDDDVIRDIICTY